MSEIQREIDELKRRVTALENRRYGPPPKIGPKSVPDDVVAMVKGMEEKIKRGLEKRSAHAGGE